MSNLDIFTEKTNTDNRCKHLCCCDKCDEIVIGSTQHHTFELPFVYSETVSSLEIIYKQFEEVVLVKDNSDCEIVETERNTIIDLTLSVDETSLFEYSCLDTFVQIKIKLLDNTTLYTDICKVNVIKPLDM